MVHGLQGMAAEVVVPMFMHTLILTSALAVTPQAQPAPHATPETPRPAGQAPSTKPDSGAHGAHGAGLAATDSAFMKKAADGGMAEVELAKLAQQKAESAEVKSYAERLEKDHTQANTELKALASQKNVTLPAEPSKPHMAMHDKLSKLSGAAFDKAYVAAMLDDHQKDVRAFQTVANGSGDADVKAFAAKTLPTLKDHLKQVQDLSKSTGAKKPTS